MLSLDKETEMFEILTGVFQGGTILRYLLIIALDYALGKAKHGGDKTLGFMRV